MTRYAITGRGVVWCFAWLGVAMPFLYFGLMYKILDPRELVIIYLLMALLPTAFVFWNSFATKLKLHREIES